MVMLYNVVSFRSSSTLLGIDTEENSVWTLSQRFLQNLQNLKNKTLYINKKYLYIINIIVHYPNNNETLFNL